MQHELEMKDHKVAFFDMMIDMAEKEFNIDIRKKLLSRAIDQYKEMNRLTKSNLCGLLGITRQKYYRSCWRLEFFRFSPFLFLS